MTPLDWPRHHPDAAAAFRAAGQWRDRSLAQSLALRLAETPGAIAITDDLGAYSYAALDARARALAGWLVARGMRRGDVLAFQLPNWHETAAIALATSMLGLVCLPIIPIYREAEVRFILTASRARLFLCPRSFRNFDHAGLAARMVAEIPTLDAAVLIRDPGAEDPFAHAPWQGAPATDAAAPWLLMYTSGTTGHPKGVVHPANTLDCDLDHTVRWWGLAAGRDAVLMPSPVTHVTGFLYGLMLPFTHGVASRLMERWDAGAAVRIIDAGGATFTLAATPFLRELLDAAADTGSRLPGLRIFACGGAPVPPDLIRRTWAAFPDLLACRVYGSTEAPTVTLGVASRADPGPAAETDGRIVGHEVRVVDDAGRPLPPGAEGEIVTRGPEMMAGYLDPADNAGAFDAEGFFRTGDLGHVSADGFVTITGRKKDLIIRGGENLSAKEIEDALHRHPAIREAAVVAMPHPRLGETGCAFLVTDGRNLDLAELSAFLDAQGLARQKHPEKIIIAKDLPRTASGKIQKYLLRAQLAGDPA
ncbi:AMP-binding protein [Ruixingdingia sedimenti]|uniref:AMP-binding protein n=1 Tax=Ruixingdingia sedimenti TaxID=3073604 RepID=A0ABU1F7E2_9RHOB|nr:AMP-binding protein [Xinfangfangia sp. LG-4]MDR5652789.1 AMP-binding protein [Xinfangfangia sp. LG-4]